MKTNTRFLLLGTLLLSACATSTTHDGLVYREGSWYSPASEGRGDYYTDSAYQHEAYDSPWSFSVGIVPFGGYCPVRYRYCVQAWDSPYWAYGYYGDPYWYSPWIYVYRPSPRPRPPLANNDPPRHRPPEIAPSTEPARPRAWEERPRPRRPSSESRPRPRVRDVFSGDGRD